MASRRSRTTNSIGNRINELETQAQEQAKRLKTSNTGDTDERMRLLEEEAKRTSSSRLLAGEIGPFLEEMGFGSGEGGTGGLDIPANFQVSGMTSGWTAQGTPWARVTFSWNAITPPEDYVAPVEYELWARRTTGDAFLLESTAGTSVTTDRLASGVTYNVKIRSRLLSGSWSNFSSEIVVVPESPAPLLPKAPIGLSVSGNLGYFTPTGAAMSNISLNWTAVTQDTTNSPIDIAVYEVWSRTGSDPYKLETATTTASAVITKPAGTSHQFQVRAISTLNNASAFSSAVSATAATPVAIAPEAPAGLNVTSNAGSFLADGRPIATIRAAWSAVTQGTDNSNIPVVAYELSLSADGTTFYSEVTTPDTSAQFTVPIAVPRYIRVRAQASNGLWSSPSSSVTLTGATPPHNTTPPSAPTLTTQLGGVVPRWDGQLTTGNVPPEFFRTTVQVSTASVTGPWTNSGVPLTAAGSGVFIPGTPGQQMWVRFFWTDTLARVSNFSTVAAVTVQSVLGSEIDDAVTQAIEDAAALAASKSKTFRQNDAPVTGMVSGDMWVDTNDNNKLYTYSGASWVLTQDANGALTVANTKIKTYAQNTSPASGMVVGDVWIDTDDSNRMYRYNGTVWVDIQDGKIVDALAAAQDAIDDASAAMAQALAAQAAADGAITTYYQAAPPWADGSTQDNDKLGDLWFDTDDNQAYRWNGSIWALIQDNAIADALAAAQNAQNTADGKITAFYQAAAPASGMDTGDLWFDTDDGNKPYRYTGSAWVTVQDGGIATAINTANSKNKTFVQSTAPSATATGDLWIDTANGNVIKRWSGSAWTAYQDAAIAAAASAASAAQTSANGKNKIYYQTAQPSGGTYQSGDLWFDTDDGYKMYTWSGTAWILTQDTAAALSAAAAKSASFVQATAPTATKAGDLWIDTGNGNVVKQWTGAAWVAVQDAGIAAAQATADAVRARGNNLITNGSATVGTNLNFSTWDLEVGDQPPGASGAFYPRSTGAGSRLTDDLIPINPAGSYSMAVDVRQQFIGADSRFYLGLAPYDIDGQSIAPVNYMEQAGTRTTLAAALSPGDTSIQLTSAANWANAAGANAHLRTIVFWNYTDGKSKLWAPGTYTRNVSPYNVWDDGAVVGNTITLRTPWTGATYPAGTSVSNGSSGGSYMYAPGISNALVPNTGEWTTFKQTIPYSGIHTDNTVSATTSFPVATSSVKVLVLFNYPPATAGSSRQVFSNFILSDTAAAILLANGALDTANGKNKIIRSVNVASGTTGYVEGDMWWRYSGTQVIAMWQFQGGAWVSQTLTDSVITDLNAATITAGTISADRIGASSIAASKLLISDFENYYFDPTFSRPAASYSPWVPTVFNSSRYLQKAGTGAQSGVYMTGEEFPVAFGEQFRFSATRENVSGTVGEASIYVHQLNAANSIVTTTKVVSMSAAGTFTGDITPISSAVTRFRVGFYTEASMTSGTTVRIKDVVIRRLQAGSLIVDGTVTTGKIAAGSITAASGIIADAAIVTAKIADAAITNAKIATLDAAKITTGTLNAGRIGANSITVDKLLVGDLSNMALDPIVEGALGINWSANSNVSITDVTGALRSTKALTNSSTTAGSFGSTGFIPVQPNADYYLEAEVYRASGTATLALQYYTDAKAVIGTLVTVGTVDSGSAWSPLGGSSKAPATAAFAKIVGTHTGTSAAVHAGWTGFVMRRMASGELIVDGAITTGKIAAGAITAGSAIIADAAITTAKIADAAISTAKIGDAQITNAKIGAVDAAKITTGTLNAGRIGANAIDATKIAANAVTAQKLIISDLSNALENPYFETNNFTGWTISGNATGWSTPQATDVDINRYMQRATTTATALSTYINNYRLPVRKGQRLKISGKSYNTGAGLSASVGVQWYNAAGAALSTSTSALTVDTAWDVFDAFEVDVPDNAYFASLRVADNGIANTTVRLSQLRFGIMNAGELIVDGSIIARQIRAGAITADKIAVGAIEARHISSGAGAAIDLTDNAVIISVKAAAAATDGTLSAVKATADAAATAGSVQAVNDTLEGVQANLENTNSTLTDVTTWFRIDPATGVTVGKEGSAVQTRIRNDRFEIVADNTVSTWWEGQLMVVPNLDALSASVANHQFSQFSSGANSGTTIKRITRA